MTAGYNYSVGNTFTNNLTSNFCGGNACSLLVHGNHLSSTMMVTDITGAVSQAVMYAPFGEIISNYNPTAWQNGIVPDYMFTAAERDEESGLDYMNARYYSSGSSTFISRDPMFEKYFWMSPYAYCANNPLKYVDPTGMDYDPVVDEEAGTITIKATYYTSEENRDEVEAAVKSWNDQSGKYQYTTGKGENQKTYTVNFDLQVEFYESDAAAETAFNKNENSGQANLVKSVKQIDGVYVNQIDQAKTSGLSDGKNIWVLKTASTRTNAHEIGHTLGLDDGGFGLMVSGGNSSKIRKGEVNDILLRAGIISLSSSGGPGTWDKPTPAQTYNMFGKLKKAKTE